MSVATDHVPGPRAANGRWWFCLGLGLVLSGIAAYFVQLALSQLRVPWYAAVVGTIGLLMMLFGTLQRAGWLRLVGLVVVALLVAGEWWFLLSGARLPQYAGPAKVGQTIPAFVAARADGQTFSDTDLRRGENTVLVMFRGRW